MHLTEGRVGVLIILAVKFGGKVLGLLLQVGGVGDVKLLIKAF